jgi:cyanophycinase
VSNSVHDRKCFCHSFAFLLFPTISPRRPFLASLAGVLLGLLPAVAAEPKVETPSPKATTPAHVGSLVIVGGGGLPESIRDRFLQLAGGKKGRLVVIPTASELADRARLARSYDYWHALGLESVKMLHTLDHKEANDPSFIKPLTEATAAWMSGGDQSRLVNAYGGTAVEQELRRLLARGGVIGGTSAGAAVMSAIMITGGTQEARIGKGFGLLPDEVVIDQHFRNRKRQERLLGVLASHPRCLGLGIDEQTAVIVCGHKFTVLGNANVSICLPPSKREKSSLKLLKAGEAGDLLELTRSVMTRLQVPGTNKPLTARTSGATTP